MRFGRAAPAGSTTALAVRQTIESLRAGALPTDGAYLLPPCYPARARRVPNNEMVIVFVLGRSDTIRVLALAPFTGADAA
jgi:hypothetical protein